MENSKFEQYKEKFLARWNSFVKKPDEETLGEGRRERIVVFIIALILAFCLWLMVNLSQEYTLTVNLPISLGMVPEDRALVENLPQSATVSVNGQGWQLINFYNNPPGINLNVSDSEVNLLEQVQQQMTLTNVSVQKVQPIMLRLNLEERISKKVPVRSLVDVTFRDQYGFVGSPGIRPDSVTVSGAISLVENITEWQTDSVQFTDVSRNLSRTVELEDPGELITLDQDEVVFSADVAEYTEGEVNVRISTRDLPEGRSVSYSPTSITVKFEVPINEYTKIQGANIFEAFVTYRQLQEDSSGFVTPQIEQSANNYHITVRSFQPPRVAYFMVLDS
jgi:YbbR domain-containing protein